MFALCFSCRSFYGRYSLAAAFMSHEMIEINPNGWNRSVFDVDLFCCVVHIVYVRSGHWVVIQLNSSGSRIELAQMSNSVESVICAYFQRNSFDIARPVTWTSFGAFGGGFPSLAPHAINCLSTGKLCEL